MRHLTSLRTKFLRTMLLVTGIIGLATLSIVVFVSTQASARHLAAVEKYLQEGIKSKGKVLTENHALALRSLTLDNAFLDMQELVERAVKEDGDLVYGLYVSAQGQTLAYTLAGAASSAETTSPDADAFRLLGFAERDLMVRKVAVWRTRRLGRDVFEVAAPVFDEAGELLGTVRYGLSTDRLHQEISRAKLDAERALQSSLLFVASLVGVAVIVGLLLSRMQGAKITRPVTELTVAAQSLAAGNRTVRVEIASGDELELLGASFNHMVQDLDASYGKLEEMNRTLEHKVARRTNELARKNRDMRLVLDNVDQGFATLSPDGTMGLERSRVVGQWFGECTEPLLFWDYMAKSSATFAEQFALGWSQLVEDVLPLEASLSQLPVELTVEGRTYSFRYLPFHRGEQLEGVLLVIADITERLVKAREEAEHNELMQVFKRLMLDRGGFETFVGETNRVLKAIGGCRFEEDRTQLKRELHTLKGNAASLGFVVLAGLCHVLEDQLADNDGLSENTLAELVARWSTILEHTREFTGTRAERVVEIPSAEYSELVTELAAADASPAIVSRMTSYALEPIERPFRRLADVAQSLARRLNKCELDVAVQTHGIRVEERFAPFFRELVHVIRNAVDHGFEPEEERVRGSKSPRGKLVLEALASAETLTIRVTDDGRGVDWPALTAKALAAGLPAGNQEQLLDALCRDGITTRDGVSSISGRGVGMAAVRQRVEALNGQISVQTEAAKGTTWLFRFPWATSVPRSGPRDKDWLRSCTVEAQAP